MNRTITFKSIFLVIVFLLLSACSSSVATEKPAASNTPLEPTLTPSPAPPTPTPIPLAATVNGEGIYLADFEAEVNRYQSAMVSSGATPSLEEQRKIVYEDIVNQMLLAQAAVKGGYTIDDQTLDKKIAELTTQSGGQEAISKWQSSLGYSPDSFKRALKLSLAAAWQRDQIIAAVPNTAEQVHVRQILVLDQNLANRIYQQLQGGSIFANLASTYDPLTGGDLGWFPRNYLTQPELENAAFSLQPGQYSQVINTSFGYQIIELIERDPTHVLSPEALRMAQQQALQKWLEDQRAQSKIEYLVK